MIPYYKDNLATIYYSDCRELIFDNISALVTDPPYELGFMGKAWDQKGVSFQVETWQYLRGLCLSGAPLLSFGGTRTFHRIACAIEDAGWEIRDTLMWVYGSGFPKSLDIGKAVDKLQGNEREFIATEKTQPKFKYSGNGRLQEKWLNKDTKDITKGNTIWEGYGTALKPAYEPIILGMNPLDGTFAENALKHKVAGLNIDGCRIPLNGEDIGNRPPSTLRQSGAFLNTLAYEPKQGRFPANFIHDGSQLVMELFPEREAGGSRRNTQRGQIFVHGGEHTSYGDNGSVARFFYCAKASKAERNAGCEGLPLGEPPASARSKPAEGRKNPLGEPRPNSHPTVKPLALMEYLVKLVKMPEYNLILDPFCGSGTTLLACIRLGIPCIGIDNDEHTCEIAARRCSQGVVTSQHGG